MSLGVGSYQSDNGEIQFLTAQFNTVRKQAFTHEAHLFFFGTDEGTVGLSFRASGSLRRRTPRLAVVEKGDARPLHAIDNLAQRVEPRPDDAVEGFHPANGPNGHFRFTREFYLLPSEQRPRGAQLPSGDDGQTKTLARSAL